MGSLDLAQIGRIQEQLAEAERPEAPQLTAEELQHYWDRGNKRHPTSPNRAIHTQANIVDGQRRWIAFCQQLPNAPDWKALLKTLSWDNRGLGESFCRYLMRRKKSAIGTLSTIRLYLRQLSAVYWKYTGAELEKRFKDHIVLILKLEIAPKFGLRVEPKHKKVLNPAGFTYLAHFRWVRDKTTFKLGLDRLDDALIRIFLMWTGCRRQELVYGQSKNLNKKVKEEYYGEPDAYTDVDDDADQYIQPRSKICWVYERVDERTTSALKVLCWEDIDLWILRDPLRDGGRDRLAMQILLRFHKGHNKEMVILSIYYPVLKSLIGALDTKSLVSLCQTCRGLRSQVQSWVWNINTKLMPFVHDPQAFRSILGASEALIYGDFATEFFSRTTSKTLAIMAKATKADPVQAYLQTQGYLLVGEERVRLGSVTRLRRGELFIILRKTRLIPIQAILSRTPTTQAMNFIAWNKAYSVFPKTTFLDHEVLPLKGADKDVRAEIARN
ncbi:hypothetical protein PG999_010000 [Apiospora kogelbergensis]|uniref:F-box domain-containing protein n=1 Tax=Apiospora kogelbergensis TaxID=1337665 RepID=A0AAW0QU95_9PEZI